MMRRPQPVSADSKQILHNAVDMQETLSVVGGSEAPHLSLPLARGLMGGFSAIVRVAVRLMDDQRHEVVMRRPVAG